MSAGPAADELAVLWFTQNRPDGISIGRRLLAAELRERGIAVDQRRTTPAAVLRSVPSVRGYDVLVGTTRAGAVAAGALATLGRRPLVVDHIDRFELFARKVPAPVARTVRAAEDAAVRAADEVLYAYEESADRLTALNGRSRRTDFGVRFDRFADPDPAVVATAERRLAALPTRENVLVYVGGLETIYNVETLLAAMEHLSDWSLVVVGDGSLRDVVAAADEEREDVHFLGTVAHEAVPGYLAAADAGVSLVDDARTLKVLEYMAAGLPVVHLDGEARERFGELVTYCDADPGSVAAAVARAPGAADPGRLRSFAAEHSWAAIAEDYAAAIRDAAGR